MQAAHLAIRLYSRNKSAPKNCRQFVGANPKKEVARFCIGDERLGVPIGLIVYAGRNHNSHWEEKPAKITKRVFASLSDGVANDPLCDLAFDLGNPTISLYADAILYIALGWHSYDVYLEGMRRLLRSDQG